MSAWRVEVEADRTGPATLHPSRATRPKGRSPLRPDGGIVAADGAGRPRAGRGVTADRPTGRTEAS